MYQTWRPNCRTPKAISLTRVSSDPKLESTSHETQHTANLRKIGELGAVLHEHYTETVSGALYKARQETQLALEDLEAGRADYLILYDMTRYGRSVRWQQEILARVEAAEARIQFATFHLDYDDETNRLTPFARAAFANFGTMSELERHNIRDRFQRRLKRDLENNVAPARSLCAFGYRVVQKADIIRGEFLPDMAGKYLVVEEQRPIVEEVFNKYLEFQALSALERYMKAKYPPEIWGRSWQRHSLLFMLRNPIYIGKPAYGKRGSIIDESRLDDGLQMHKWIKKPREKWHFLECEPIVSEKIYNECARLLDEGKKRAGNPRRRYALTSLLICPGCGKKMQGNWNKTASLVSLETAGQDKLHSGDYKASDLILYYNCQHSSRRNKFCKNVNSVRCAVLENEVTEAILAAIENSWVINQSISDFQQQRKVARATLGTDRQLEAAKKSLKAAQKRERALAEQVIEARLKGQSVDVYDDMIADLDREKKAWEQIIEANAAESYDVDQLGVVVLDVARQSQQARRDLQKILTADYDTVPPVEKNKIFSSLVTSIIPESRDVVRLTLRTNPLSQIEIQIVSDHGKLNVETKLKPAP